MFVARKKNFSSQMFSLVLHVVVIGLLYLIQFIKLSSPSINSVVTSSVRVDIVAMPRFTLQELKKMQQRAGDREEDNIQEQRQDPQDDDLLVKKKKVNFAQLMKQLANKKVEKVKLKRLQHKKRGIKLGRLSGKLKQLLHSGNKIREGSSIAGEGSQLSAEKFEQYLQQLPDIVRIHWKLPTYLLGKNLRCRIRIFLDESGQVVRSEVIETSGELEYDKRALRAIQEVGQFPAIPQEIISRVIRGDIVLGFPL